MAWLDYLRQLNFVSVALRLLFAMFFGGMLGMDRAKKHRAAGFRTYMLVCLGATLTAIISQYLFVMISTDWAETAALVGRKVDVSRISAKAIGGVGFLGAGTIIVTGHQEVKGLTTAAALWASACMGVAIGAGFYECVVVAFVLMVLCMRFLSPLESYIVERARNINLYVELESLDNVGQIINCIKAQDVHIYGVELDRGREGRRPSAVFTLRLNHWMPHEQLLTAISDLENVTTIDEI
jgi:putative Mg2+ transporter-C (MgtC) family protein